jgi:hypothetical protein
MDRNDHLIIAEFLKELEESIFERDDGPVSWHCERETVQNIIKQLMVDTFNETNPTDRSRLALLEYKARKIRDCIFKRNQMKN